MRLGIVNATYIKSGQLPLLTLLLILFPFVISFLLRISSYLLQMKTHNKKNNKDMDVRSVWANNLHQEMAMIDQLVRHRGFRHAAIDTEFPGVYFRNSKPYYSLSSAERYALLKANVDLMSLIQLGLALYDDHGVCCVWEFNFSDFDVENHPHAPESIHLLQSQGLDFGLFRKYGIDSRVFAQLLVWHGLVGNGNGNGHPTCLEWVAFSSSYDFAYLVKVLRMGRPLPTDMSHFLGILHHFFGDILDVKHMLKACDGELSGGLERVAEALNIKRAAGEAHQAGSDSLLLCHVLLKMKHKYIVDTRSYTGVLCGLQVS